MTEIAGYVYSADIYCSEHCVLLGSSFQSLEHWARTEGINWGDEGSYDSDVFPKVILSSSESGDSPDTCCKCHTLLDTSWSGDTVDTAVGMLRDYAVSFLADETADDGKTAIRVGNAEYLDEIHEHLTWSIVGKRNQLVIDFYGEVRDYEND